MRIPGRPSSSTLRNFFFHFLATFAIFFCVVRVIDDPPQPSPLAEEVNGEIIDIRVIS